MAMLDTLGSFATIWLSVWLLLSVLFVIVYPLVRVTLFKLHPRLGSNLLLAYLSAPFLMSLVSVVLLYFPGIEAILVDKHCHRDCAIHVPAFDSALLALPGLLLLGIILCVFVVKLCVNLIVAGKLRKQFQLLAKRQGEFYLIQSPDTLVFTLGWWNPAIYISEGLIDQCEAQDLEIVLCHEIEHRSRKDNLRILLVRVFHLLLPWPVVKNLLDDLRLLAEESCDFSAAARFGDVGVATALLRLQKITQHRRTLLPAFAAAFGEHQVESRIIALLSIAERRVLSSFQLGILCVSMLLYFVLIINPLHHGSEWLIAFLMG